AGSWSSDGTILFNASGNGGLRRVSATGGVGSPVTTLGQGEIRHVDPYFLPDGQHFLFCSAGIVSNIYVGSLNTKERRELLRDVGFQVAYSQDRLFFKRVDMLMEQGFDAAGLRLLGEPSPVAETPVSTFSVSTGGALAYKSGPQASGSQLAWF